MYVLLIEDYLPLVQTLTRSLGALGIRVEACGDGLLADDLLKQHDFDAVAKQRLERGFDRMVNERNVPLFRDQHGHLHPSVDCAVESSPNGASK